MAQNLKTLRNSAYLYSNNNSKLAASEFEKGRRIGSGWFQSKTYHPINLSCLSLSNSNPNPNPNTSLKKCLRCNTLFNPLHNSAISCHFHGHVTGEKGLLGLAPPHQSIDGEWSDGSGVIVYKNERPNNGSANWKKRWSMMKTQHPVDEDATSLMIMASLCIS